MTKKILVGTGFDHQLQFQKKLSFQRFLDIRFVYKGSSSSSETRHEGMILGVKFTFDKEKSYFLDTWMHFEQSQ